MIKIINSRCDISNDILLLEYINNKRKELGINIPFNIESYLNGNILKPNIELNIKLNTDKME